MESGACAARGVPLVRKIRLVIGRSAGAAGAALPRRAALRRDVGGLLERLERLRRAFPETPELADRVRLSPHVIGLLDEARGVPAAGAVPRVS